MRVFSAKPSLTRIFPVKRGPTIFFLLSEGVSPPAYLKFPPIVQISFFPLKAVNYGPFKTVFVSVPPSPIALSTYQLPRSSSFSLVSPHTISSPSGLIGPSIPNDAYSRHSPPHSLQTSVVYQSPPLYNTRRHLSRILTALPADRSFGLCSSCVLIPVHQTPSCD